MILDNGWRWSIRFAATLSALMAIASPAYASIDGYDNVGDVNSLYVSAQKVIDADDFWRRGHTGGGIDVAVIDTGVSKVPGLDAPGKVVYGPDLSFDSQNDELRHQDAYGHGTNMAGIIAGRDAGFNRENGEDANRFLGVAPDARIISIKAGESYGAVDVSQIVAAIEWTVENRRAHGLNIRVLNLSYGTDGVQAYTSDPVAHAVERAWKAGITVVVSAGNGGFGSAKLNNPALNPFVIAVGGTDARGTRSTLDDIVPDWSSTGDTVRNPDLVAPGRSVTSLRVPGSVLDEAYPEARVGDRFFKGSGTSQAAAFVSGAAALLLDESSGLTPDQVKAKLLRYVSALPVANPVAQGAGVLNLDRDRDVNLSNLPRQTYLASTGTGTLEGARGTVHVEADGVALRGEQDILGYAWRPVAYSSLSAVTDVWRGGSFLGVPWTGDSFTDGVFGWVGWVGAGEDYDGDGVIDSVGDEVGSDTTWSGSRWSGSRWSGSRWSGSRWSGSRWSGSRWSGSRWSGSRWSGSRWSGSRWSGSRWSSAGWGAAAPTVVGGSDPVAAELADAAVAGPVTPVTDTVAPVVG